MKITYKNAHGMVVHCQNPDEAMKQELFGRVRDSLLKEQDEFVQEVGVALRKLKPGQKRQLRSKPISVEIERVPDQSTLLAAPEHAERVK